MVTLLLLAFFLAQQNCHTVSYEKPLLMRSPVNTANGHILKFQTVESSILSPPLQNLEK